MAITCARGNVRLYDVYDMQNNNLLTLWKARCRITSDLKGLAEAFEIETKFKELSYNNVTMAEWLYLWSLIKNNITPNMIKALPDVNFSLVARELSTIYGDSPDFPGMNHYSLVDTLKK